MQTTEILRTIQQALSVITQIAATPGVNLIPYANIVAAAAGAISAGIDAGINVTPYIEAFKKTFDGDVPTQTEIDELRTKITDLEAQIDAPPPPAEEGEPE